MKKILVIDDEVALCQLMKMYLEKDGDYQIDTAHSGLEGVRKASQSAYDAAVVDVLLPDISGLETYKRIRSLAGAKGQLPVVAISARPSMKDIFHMANVHAFLGKPFQMEQMREILDALCHTGESRSKSSPVPAAVESSQAPRKIFVAGMEKFIVEKIRDYLQQLGLTVVTNYDEHDSLSLAAAEKPALILYQYWEESEKFNAPKLFKQTASNAATKNIPCFVFCTKSGEFEAVKEVPKDKLLTYQDSRELLSKLRSYLPR